MPEHVLRDNLTIFSQTKNLQLVREFVTGLVTASALPREDHRKVILAVDEAVANIIQHGYDSDEHGVIDVIIEGDNERFAIIVRDSGLSFDPANADMPDIEAHFQQGRKHGLGVFLMRKIMDVVEYSFVEGVRNELRLVKYVGARPAGGGGSPSPPPSDPTTPTVPDAPAAPRDAPDRPSM